MEDLLTTWRRASGERDFLLVIAGRISGVHDEKGKHRPIACQVAGATVIIQFEGTESLTISNPRDMIIGPNGELIVRDASEATFTWYSQVAHELCEEVFNKVGRFINFRRTGAAFATSAFLPYKADVFIVLRAA